ncbi:MAG: nucleotidyltransferase family protein [Marmoricola sp.]
MTTVGLLLAAGGGRRMGMPKALVSDASGPWLSRAVETLQRGGCDRVVVVLGASADEARPLLDAYDVTVVVAADWDDGMGASLATGLGNVLHSDATRCLVTLVDLPDIGPDVVRRMLDAPDQDDVLARATYDGRPGHPVLLGRDHWAGVLVTSTGDRGARDYLASHALTRVECADLATGKDVDRPPRRPTGGQPPAR